MQGNLFWQLGTLSDEALIDGLNRVVVSGRRMLAEVLAHLCEVENRRLHLDTGYPSMFAYCTGRLGFSEDEAYRRIEVARLARRAPMVFELIAGGRLSLSAAALLKPHLLAPNLSELVQAVSHKSVQAAREVLAAFFPRPDVVDSVRKLPQHEPAPRHEPATPLFEERYSTSPRMSGRAPDPTAAPPATSGSGLSGAVTPPSLELIACIEKRAAAPSGGPSPAPTTIAPDPRTRPLEPLSPGRKQDLVHREHRAEGKARARPRPHAPQRPQR